MKAKLTAIFFLFLTIALLFVAGNPLLVRSFEFAIIKKGVRDVRAVSLLNSVKKQVGIQENVSLYTYEPVEKLQNNKLTSLAASWIYRDWHGTVCIAVENYLLSKHLSDLQLQAVLAHELGHLAKGHLDQRREWYNSHVKEGQEEADDVAKKIVGEGALRSAHFFSTFRIVDQ